MVNLTHFYRTAAVRRSIRMIATTARPESAPYLAVQPSRQTALLQLSQLIAEDGVACLVIVFRACGLDLRLRLAQLRLAQLHD